MSPAAALAVALQPTLPLSALREFPNNPRQHWGVQDDLIASVRAKGVLEPLTVRPKNGYYEILNGARRFRAAKEAGLTDVPVTVREASDQEALEIAVILNLQREDVHPLDEARAYERLNKADATYTVPVIAAKVGKDISYVYRRLKLLALCADARAAFEKDEITVAHAERLARLDVAKQQEALDVCFYPLFRGGEERREPAPVSKLDIWIESHVKTDLRDEATPHYFPELVEDVVEAAGASTILELSESHRPGADLGEKKDLPLGRARWQPVLSKQERCAHVERGAVVHGGPMRVLDICRTKGCPTHFPDRTKAPASGDTSSRPAMSSAPDPEIENRKRRAAERANHVVSGLVVAIAETTKTLDLGLVAEALYQQVGSRYEPALKALGIKRFSKLSPMAKVKIVTLLALARHPDLAKYFYGYETKPTIPAELLKLAKAAKVDVKAIEAAARKQMPEPGDEVKGQTSTAAAKKGAKKR